MTAELQSSQSNGTVAGYARSALDIYIYIYIHTDKTSLRLIGRIGGSGWGLTWIYLDSLGFIWTHLDSLGITWFHLGEFEFTWKHLDLFELTWIHLDAFGFI